MDLSGAPRHVARKAPTQSVTSSRSVLAKTSMGPPGMDITKKCFSLSFHFA